MPTDLPTFSDNRGTVIRLLLETDVNLDSPKPEDFKRLITLVVSTIHEKLKNFAPTTRVTVIEPDPPAPTSSIPDILKDEPNWQGESDQTEHCYECGKPGPALHESTNWWEGVRGTRKFCCSCYVNNGNPPADWHAGCVAAYEQLKKSRSRG